jgi:hypothetical protein
MRSSTGRWRRGSPLPSVGCSKRAAARDPGTARQKTLAVGSYRADMLAARGLAGCRAGVGRVDAMWAFEYARA